MPPSGCFSPFHVYSTSSCTLVDVHTQLLKSAGIVSATLSHAAGALSGCLASRGVCLHAIFSVLIRLVDVDSLIDPVALP